ncbi:MAG TPA: hypothetical protein VIR31_05445, partial [Nitrososphaeraceae archaeon]
SEEQINKVANGLGLNRSRPVIFIHISGPIETRTPIIRIILEACKSLRREVQYIISEGKPKGNLEPKKNFQGQAGTTNGVPYETKYLR